MGNAQNLSAKSKMWRAVLDELRKRDCLGDAFPVACQRHADVVQRVSKPGQLPRLAPDGMSFVRYYLFSIFPLSNRSIKVDACCSATLASSVGISVHTR